MATSSSVKPVGQLHRTVWNHEDIGREGYWGAATASIDWCEANFIHSKYIAEMFNTISNSFMILLAIYGIRKVYEQRLPNRLVLSYASLAIVGIGSAMFHATLQYSWQLGDELPMIYTSTIIAWLVFDLSPIGQKTPILPPLALLIFNIAFTLMYLFYPNPVFHQVAYGTLVVATALRGFWLITTQIPDKALSKQAIRLQIWGSAAFVLGFAIWNIDNIFCDTVWTPLKKQVGAPFNVLLEGHSWWHILTGLGCYEVICALSLITLSIRDDPKHYQLRFRWGFIAWIERTPAGWKALEKEGRSVSGVDGERTRLLK